MPCPLSMKLRTGISPSQYPKTDLHELGDLRGIGLVAEDVDLRGSVVEIAPRVEMDDFFRGHIWRCVIAHGCV